MKNFLVYKSSAGSGKTFTLVKTYLSIILKSDQNPYLFSKVLAITFTNDAANEMKERVISTLKNLVNLQEKDKGMRALLAKELQVSEETLKQRAEEVLNSILHNYANLSISTIDKFTHRIIRSFSRELGLSSSFEVELDAEEINELAVSQMLEKIEKGNSNITQWLLKYVYQNLENEKTWNVKDEIIKLFKTTRNEDAQEITNPLLDLKLEDFERIRNEKQTFNNEFEKQVKEVANQMIEKIKENQLEVDDFSQKKKGLYAKLKQLMDAKNFSVKPYRDGNINKQFEKGVFYTGKAKGHPQTTIEGITPFLMDKIRELDQIFEAYFDQYQLNQTYLKNIFNTGVIHEILKEIEEIKSSQNILLIEEFNQKLFRVTENDPVPFIYEKLGDRYEYFLIDEFQDTSKKQWRNLLPLVTNALDEGKQVLIVGDAKQAIYRWRGGDVEQFVDLRHIKGQEKNIILEQQADTINYNYSEEKLENNWRSAPEIVEFNNTLFSDLIKRLPIKESLKEVYLDVAQIAKKITTQGYVHFKEYNSKGETESIEHTILQEMFDKIQACIEDGFQYGDIAVLIRSAAQANKVSEFLREKKVKVQSADSLKLASSSSVQLLFSVLKYYQNPTQKINQVKILELLGISPFNVSEKEFETILEEYISIQWKEHFGTLSLYNKMEFLVLSLVKSNVFELDAFVQFYLDISLDFQNNKGDNLEAFIDELENKLEKESVVVSEDPSAIKLTTIHKSKGLQYPIVMMPFVQKKKDSYDAYWVEIENQLPIYVSRTKTKGKENGDNKFLKESFETEYSLRVFDDLNVIYVAFTRPELRLYVWHDSDSTSLFQKELTTLLSEKSDDGVLEIGFPVRKEDPDSTSEELSSQWYTVGDYSNKIEFSYNEHLKRNPEIEKKRELGNLFHEIMANSFTEETAIQKLNEVGDIEGKEILEAEINQVFSKEKLSNWLQNRNSFSEKAITDELGNNHIPDRIVFKEDSTIVIDFKTGATSQKHHNQVKEYLHLLQRMNYKNLHGVIYYTHSNELIEVEWK